MSGGRYNYACSRVEDFAEKMQVTPRFDEDGQPMVDSYVDYDLRRRFRAHLEKVAAAMRAIEWNDSGDGARDESVLILRCLHGDEPVEPGP